MHPYNQGMLVNQPLAIAFAACCAATLGLYAGVVLPRLRRDGNPWDERPAWRYFRNLQSYQELARHDPGAVKPWLPLAFTAASLVLGLALASLHFRAFVNAWE